MYLNRTFTFFGIYRPSTANSVWQFALVVTMAGSRITFATRSESLWERKYLLPSVADGSIKT